MRDEKTKTVMWLAFGLFALGAFMALWVQAIEPGLPTDEPVRHVLGLGLFLFGAFFVRRFVPVSCERRAEARARRRNFRGY